MDLGQCRTIILNTFSTRGGLELARAALDSDPPEEMPHQPADNLPWCVCRKCRVMSTSMENVCCRQSSCTTSSELLESSVLDINVLSIAIANRSDTFVEPVDYSPASFGKALMGNLFYGGKGILGGVIVRWYLLAWSGVLGTDTLLLMVCT